MHIACENHPLHDYSNFVQVFKREILSIVDSITKKQEFFRSELPLARKYLTTAGNFIAFFQLRRLPRLQVHFFRLRLKKNMQHDTRATDRGTVTTG